MDEFNITIIGAGVIGLAIADELAKKYDRILLIEKHPSFGQETSSRNSEVIHAGIYYQPEFLKSTFCVEGNRFLYETCQKRNIPHRQLGKLIVATTKEECGELAKIKKNAESNGVLNLYWIDKNKVYTLEPNLNAEAALFSPSTGIINTHSLMRSFLLNAESNGTITAFRSAVSDINKTASGYEIEINEGQFHFLTRIIINSAGLHADKIAEMVGIDIDQRGYRLKFCKGNYFWASPSPTLSHLVYPVPPANNEYLGIHTTIDLGGRVRFGPDIQYVNAIEYSVDTDRKDNFHKSVSKYLLGISWQSLYPDMSGIRPKLHGPEEPNKDFIIHDEKDEGYPGLINLIGIESPGLTSCIAIARYVSSLVKPYLE